VEHRWHIDYLLEYGQVLAIRVTNAGRSAECEESARVRALDRARLIIPGFGASDCDCPADLYYFPFLTTELRTFFS